MSTSDLLDGTIKYITSSLDSHNNSAIVLIDLNLKCIRYLRTQYIDTEIIFLWCLSCIISNREY